jgi:hypothetical protein
VVVVVDNPIQHLLLDRDRNPVNKIKILVAVNEPVQQVDHNLQITPMVVKIINHHKIKMLVAVNEPVQQVDHNLQTTPMVVKIINHHKINPDHQVKITRINHHKIDHDHQVKILKVMDEKTTNHHKINHVRPIKVNLLVVQRKILHQIKVNPVNRLHVHQQNQKLTRKINNNNKMMMMMIKILKQKINNEDVLKVVKNDNH